jgi:hypothetical protein
VYSAVYNIIFAYFTAAIINLQKKGPGFSNVCSILFKRCSHYKPVLATQSLQTSYNKGISAGLEKHDWGTHTAGAVREFRDKSQF